jgi:hypothetical protein
MVLFGSVLLIAAVVLFILQPIVRGQWASLRRGDDEMTETQARRRVTLLALRDVEYDYHTGKLDEVDYQELRGELSTEALEALEAAAREAEGDDAHDLEAEIAAVRHGLDAGTTCGECGHRNPEGSRFCASCGRRLAESREASARS